MDNLFLISALGNPGEQYANTRHNAGRVMLDFIIEKLGLIPERQLDKKHQASIRKTQISINEVNKGLWGRNIPFGLYPIIFCKPQTYMNLSGQSVQSLIQYYKIPSTHLLVIHDDLDQSLGEIKYKKQGGSGGQNGIKHITSKLNTEQYFRLKIGIGRPENPKFSVIDRVLHTFSDDEKKILYNLSEKCIHTIGLFLQGKS